MSEDRPARGIDAVPPEHELARKELAFPGMGVLLDLELFCGLVRLHTRGEPGPGRLVDLRYRPGSKCVATYVFGDGPDGTWVHARALGSGAERGAGRAPDREPTISSSSELGFGRLSLNDYGLVVRAFPHDDGLPALADLDDPAARERLLATVLPHQPVDRMTVRTVSY